jgi:hypothetical protein
MNKLHAALEILYTLDEYSDVQLIALLNWKSVPEVYKLNRSFIYNNHRIEEYKNGSTIIVNIQGIGTFQLA